MVKPGQREGMELVNFCRDCLSTHKLKGLKEPPRNVQLMLTQSEILIVDENLKVTYEQIKQKDVVAGGLHEYYPGLHGLLVRQGNSHRYIILDFGSSSKIRTFYQMLKRLVPTPDTQPQLARENSDGRIPRSTGSVVTTPSQQRDQATPPPIPSRAPAHMTCAAIRKALPPLQAPGDNSEVSRPLSASRDTPSAPRPTRPVRREHIYCEIVEEDLQEGKKEEEVVDDMTTAPRPPHPPRPKHIYFEVKAEQKEEEEEKKAEDEDQKAKGQKAKGQKAKGQKAKGQKAKGQKAKGQKAKGQKAKGQKDRGKVEKDVEEQQQQQEQQPQQLKQQHEVPGRNTSGPGQAVSWEMMTECLPGSVMVPQRLYTYSQSWEDWLEELDRAPVPSRRGASLRPRKQQKRKTNSQAPR